MTDKAREPGLTAALADYCGGVIAMAAAVWKANARTPCGDCEGMPEFDGRPGDVNRACSFCGRLYPINREV